MQLTQEQMIDPDLVTLYYTMHETGAAPEDESCGTIAPYSNAGDSLHAATARDPELHTLALALDEAAGDLAVTLFEEGFRRSVAFTRSLAARPDHAAVPQLAA